MPEGPSIVILKEQLSDFRGKKILKAEGNAKIDIQRMKGKMIRDLKSWGKHFIMEFDAFFIRIHFLMFGSYRINDRKETAPRLSLKINGGEVNFYTCSVKMFEGSPDEVYDYERDVMSDTWSAKKARATLLKMPKEMVCDVLLNQDIFAGVGNIIKNEVLFRIRVHPETRVGALPLKKLKQLIAEARTYSFDFYHWKKSFVLKKNWKIYKKKVCPECNSTVRGTYLGRTERLTSFCRKCQVRYK